MKEKLTPPSLSIEIPAKSTFFKRGSCVKTRNCCSRDIKLSVFPETVTFFSPEAKSKVENQTVGRHTLSKNSKIFNGFLCPESKLAKSATFDSRGRSSFSFSLM